MACAMARQAPANKKICRHFVKLPLQSLPDCVIQAGLPLRPMLNLFPAFRRINSILLTKYCFDVLGVKMS